MNQILNLGKLYLIYNQDRICLQKNTEVSMNVRAAWNSGYTGKGVLVAVVDDGVNMNHPDLEDNFVSLITSH
mgnify:CR=1 FL=1